MGSGESGVIAPLPTSYSPLAGAAFGMALELLSPDEQWVVRQALAAITQGAYLDDESFAERIGVERAELAALLADWPRVDDTRRDAPAGFAINNCLNEICYELRIEPTEWNRWFDVPRDEVAAVYRRWAMLKGWSTPGVR